MICAALCIVSTCESLYFETITKIFFIMFLAVLAAKQSFNCLTAKLIINDEIENHVLLKSLSFLLSYLYGIFYISMIEIITSWYDIAVLL